MLARILPQPDPRRLRTGRVDVETSLRWRCHRRGGWDL